MSKSGKITAKMDLNEEESKLCFIDPIEAINDEIESVFIRNSRDIRGLCISSDGKHLISCSEVWDDDIIGITFCSTETGESLELRLDKKELPTSLNNWLLCVDVQIVQLKETKYWLVSAGSKNGDLYLWAGKIYGERWDFTSVKSKCISRGLSEAHTKSILTLKMVKNPTKQGLISIYSGGKDRRIKVWNLEVTADGPNFDAITVKNLKGDQQHLGWILTLDITSDNRLLFSGSTKDNKIILWNLEREENKEIISHKMAITALNVSPDDKKLAASSQDYTIGIYDLSTQANLKESYGLHDELIGHQDAVVAIDFLKYGNYLASASKDNTIRIWDLENGACIRTITLKAKTLKELEEKFDPERELGGIHLRLLALTPDNRYIFASLNNKILKIRNRGMVWHFCKQLIYIQNSKDVNDRELYKKIYGENLKQLAINSEENRDTLSYMYDLIISRLKKVHEKLRTGTSEYNHRILGSLFISSFLKLAPEGLQKEYISSVRTKYKSYWNSTIDLFQKLPDLKWSFKLFLTSDSDDLKDSTFIEVIKPESSENDTIFIKLKDRHQSALNFLMVLENFPAIFIPLLNALVLSVEDDRGNSTDLKFTDFIYSEDFKIFLKNQKDSKKKPLQITDFYSTSIFKLDEGYSTEKFALFRIKKISIEFTETLNPTKMGKSEHDKRNIFDSFRYTINFPILPSIRLQMGTGPFSWLGRGTDIYLARIVFVGIFGTLLDLTAGLLTLWDIPIPISFSLALVGSIFMAITIIWMAASGLAGWLRGRKKYS